MIEMMICFGVKILGKSGFMSIPKKGKEIWVCDSHVQK